MIHFCSLVAVANCNGEHPSCGSEENCGGHLHRICHKPAEWRLESHDGHELQYACEDHCAVIAGRMRSGEATRL